MLCSSARQLFARAYSTASAGVKPSVALLARLRKEIEGVPITRAKEALVQSNNDYAGALQWLRDHEAAEGLKKAVKVGSRVAKDGLIAAYLSSASSTSGTAASLIELNTETDFVARSPAVQQLCINISRSIAYAHSQQRQQQGVLAHVDVDKAKALPLLDCSSASKQPVESGKTVQDGIVDAIGRLGENISLRRAAVVVTAADESPVVVGGYVHGTDAALSANHLGRVGALVTLRRPTAQPASNAADDEEHVRNFAKQLARVVVGFNPADRQAFLDTPFIFRNPLLDAAMAAKATGGQEGQLVVRDALAAIRLDVQDHVRYELGEGIEKEETDFAEEVKRQLNK
ncbi:Elongation factor Ts, mitochondrial [Sorochytrium milnesiophthora]